MAFLTPTIRSLNPSNTITLVFPPGSMQGFSGPLSLVTDVQSPPGVPLPLNGTWILTIINSDQYRFLSNDSELSSGFVQQVARQPIQVPFQIKNIHVLSPTPAPLILTLCTFDNNDGIDFKRCHSGSFKVTAGKEKFKLKSFK